MTNKPRQTFENLSGFYHPYEKSALPSLFLFGRPIEMGVERSDKNLRRTAKLPSFNFIYLQISVFMLY